MTNREFQPGSGHPDEWQADLNPNAGAGLNHGLDGQNSEKADNAPCAYDIKELHGQLQGYTDDELKEITLMPTGSRLEQGKVYLDLHDPDPQPFRAMGGQVAEAFNWYVPKTEVDYVLWNRLTGVENPARLDEADEAATT